MEISKRTNKSYWHHWLHKALPRLKELIAKQYKHTIIYQELGFSIMVLENAIEPNLTFLFNSIKEGNILQISGACSAILYKKIVPNNCSGLIPSDT